MNSVSISISISLLFIRNSVQGMDMGSKLGIDKKPMMDGVTKVAKMAAKK